jgi:UDP-glucose 4-epimerase
MNSVIISGALGFIGSHVTKRCLDEGMQVLAVDDLSNGHHEFAHKGASLFLRDFADPMILDIVRKQHYSNIVHLAANPRVLYSIEHPLETHDTNVTKTLKLIDAAVGNVKRFIFASSCAVYGSSSTPLQCETHVRDPQSPYALQKGIVEDYINMYSLMKSFDSVSLRFFNVYGENALGGSVYATALSSWLRSLVKGEPLRSDGDGTQSRDMVHVSDVVEAIMCSLKRTQPLTAVKINVGTGHSVSNNHILDLIREKEDPRSIQIVQAPWRKGDVMHTCASTETAESMIGFKAAVPFDRGFDRTYQWAMESDLFRAEACVI